MNAYLPPLMIRVRVREAGARGFRLWLPIVLLWPLLLPLLVLTLIVTLLVDLALLASGARYHHYTRLVLGSLRVLAEVRGTHVDAVTEDSFVKVDIY
ncbi:MAG: hypothetical protein ISP10_05600 [Aeromicrobium sp.]|nr:hypothetical protein [Aeromicrobium sp.]